jgi:hypothetical protein
MGSPRNCERPQNRNVILDELPREILNRASVILRQAPLKPRHRSHLISTTESADGIVGAPHRSHASVPVF